MACVFLTQHDLISGILNCTLPEDTIDMDKKDRSTQVIKCSPCGTEVQPFTSLKKKMAELVKCRQIIATPFANKSFQPRPKVSARKHNLVPLPRLNRAKLFQPRKISVGLLHEATQWNWAASLGKAKDAAGITTSLAPIQTSQLMDTPSTLSPTSPNPPIKSSEHSNYCAICTPLGKICLKEFPMSSDWDYDEEEEKD